jgi:DNA-binding response OmpR family regulator
MVGLGFMRLIAEYSAELVHLRGLNPRERSDVPVIMLSAKDTEVDKAVGLELGADDYVTKPFTWRGLAARIEAMLSCSFSAMPSSSSLVRLHFVGWAGCLVDAR